MGSMLLSHQFFWIIVFVLMVPYLLKVKMDAGPSGWLAAAMADWQNRHKKSHQIRLSIFFLLFAEGRESFHCNSNREFIIFIYTPFLQHFCVRH